VTRRFMNGDFPGPIR